MRIHTPAEIEQVAWEGALEPLGETFKFPLQTRVTLGQPAWWPAAEAVEGETGKTWTPPPGDRRYTLLRLACTLHPPSEPRAHYIEATLTAYLRPRAAGAGAVVAHDLYPRRLTVDGKRTLKVGLGPDLKFAEAVEVSLLEVGAEIEMPRAFPVVQGYGLGESRPYWRFAHHTGYPLAGCQSVYAVVDAPGAAGGIRLSVELVATLETRYGPVRLGLPQEAADHVSRVIGDQRRPT